MLLQVKSAEFRYGDVTIFKDVNLEVNYGENIGLSSSKRRFSFRPHFV